MGQLAVSVPPPLDVSAIPLPSYDKQNVSSQMPPEGRSGLHLRSTCLMKERNIKQLHTQLVCNGCDKKKPEPQLIWASRILLLRFQTSSQSLLNWTDFLGAKALRPRPHAPLVWLAALPRSPIFLISEFVLFATSQPKAGKGCHQAMRGALGAQLAGLQSGRQCQAASAAAPSRGLPLSVSTQLRHRASNSVVPEEAGELC